MKRAREQGFTLLELLLVVFLLAALAASAATLADDLDLQARSELSASRRDQVREAVLGSPTRTVNSEPLLSGFVADMGRLPADLRELLIPPVDTASVPVGWEIADGIGRGWRGPYLRAEFEDQGGVQTPVFRDGWGNRDLDAGVDALNNGWRFSSDASGRVDLGSFGRHGRADTGGEDAFDLDLPAPPDAGDDNDPAWLVRPADWSLDLSGWQVTITSAALGGLTNPQLRLLVPSVEGDVALDPDGDGWRDDASLITPAIAAPVSPQLFTFPSPPVATPPPPVRQVPAGVRGIALVEQADPDTLLFVWPVSLPARVARPTLNLSWTP